MPIFAYKAIDKGGKTSGGTIEAADRKGAIRALTAKGLSPTSIEQHQDAASVAQESFEANHDYFGQKEEEAKPRKGQIRLFQSRKPKRVVSLNFLRNLLMLLQSGLPMGDSLRLLHSRVGDAQQKELAAGMWKRISEGRTLSGAMQDFPEYFGESQVQLVAAGEASGRLPVVLERVVAYLEESAALRKKISAGLAYPIFIVSLALVIVVFFLLFLLPIVRKLLKSMGGDLQFFAKVLIGGGETLLFASPIIAALAAVLAVALANWRKTPTGRIRSDRWLLRLPVYSPLYQHQHILQTTILMATLLDSGVNTPDALRLVERTVGNTILRGAYSAMRRMIQEGASLSAAYRQTRIMPDMDVDILAVGENTGSLSASLRRIHEIHREALDKGMSVLTVVITSVALFAAFAIVAMIALSLVLSVLDISHSLTFRK